MEVLTAQQKANRAYYAKNVEKIKARKKAAYKKKTEKAGTSKAVTKKSKLLPKKLIANADDLPRMRARRRIEDYRMAKELGVNLMEICG